MLLPYAPESPGRARQFVTRVLTEWGLGPLVDAAKVITSELVTNAARTGCRRQMMVTVRLISRTTVRISVYDGSRALPVLIEASRDEECHRGLALVHHLTHGCWGVTPLPLGKVVHADLTVAKPTAR
ncbi:ATP-binding protein [Kitasatospora sp. A2-31]|uniref:ATP-binding protein n=1 Tax=Kitasatospora sp. A2-31 TaxID=2916414 RepID=UPI001EED4D71|nr:ATP-binding protein [Kitasatospora sp. A2-31]MCG6499655.1 ATP-binding protein [Kitasatospora sp. A2-31]